MVRRPAQTRFAPSLYDRFMAPLEHRSLGRWRRALWSHVPLAERGLEIGAGTGANFRYYPENGRPIATDRAPAMLREAWSKPDRRGAQLLGCDVQALPFRDAAFDWAAATLLFCEVPDPVAGLREVRRVLKPGGRLFLLEHVRPSGWLGRMADGATALTGPLIGEHFNRDTMAHVRAAGFHAESQEWLWRDGVVLILARREEVRA